MNRLSSSLVGLMILALSLVSCTKESGNQAQIAGVFKGESKNKEIHLCKVEHGTTKKIATTFVNENGEFGFSCPINDPGLYVVNVVWESIQQTVKKDHNLKRFYLEKGTQVDIELNEGSYKLLKTNSKKNELLSKWNSMADTMFTYSHGFRYNFLSYEDFFPLLPGFVEDADIFKSEVNSDDHSFNDLLKLMVDLDMKSSAVNFLYTPKQKHPTRDIYPEYYDYLLEEGAPKSERILELANAKEYLRFYSMFKASNSKIDLSNETERLAAQLGSIENDLLKGYFAIDHASRIKVYDARYLSFKKTVMTYLQTKYLRSKLEDHEISIRKFSKGDPAFNFEAEDVTGKTHKFSDFKGKLVYIDLWATWCGPCKAEIPALKELEKKYHGKPVVFVSISMDTQKDRQKWINFVKKENLTGIQLITDNDFDSAVSTAYSINQIPRFMLFDKEGTIISENAPRPSDKKIEEMLNEFL